MKILVAIDTSKSSQIVLERALYGTWAKDAEFCVLNVVNLQRFEKLPALIEDATRESESFIKAGAKRLADVGFKVISRTMCGHPRSDISRFAKEWGADLILIGSHGHGAIGRFLLGSIAQGVLRTAPCSVEIVRPPVATAPNQPIKVLLATDGSDCSLTAARSLAGQRWPNGSTFRVISVEELVSMGNQMDASSLSAVYPASLLDRLAEDSRQRASAAVETAKKILIQAGFSLDSGDSMPFGDPRSVVLDIAKECAANLIVLGSHGRRGIDRFLLGSVSEAVAVHAPCSVRVVRSI